MKEKLNPIESKIITVLVQNGDYMTTAQIAKEAKISWNTAINYLTAFHKKGWVEKAGDTVISWRAILEGE
ncbi:MAG: winged helix-turn-helix transcriptional regulator [Nanoarchaeota archaeon]